MIKLNTKQKMPVFLMTAVIIPGLIIAALGIYLVSQQKSARLLDIKKEFSQRLAQIQNTGESRVRQLVERVFQQRAKSLPEYTDPAALTPFLKTLVLDNPIVKYPFFITSQQSFLFPYSKKTLPPAVQSPALEVERIPLEKPAKQFYTEGYDLEYRQRDFGSAIRSYLKSLEKNPGVTSRSYIYGSIARCYFKMRQFPQAVHYYFKTLRENPDLRRHDFFLYLTVLRQLGLAYHQSDSPEKAVKYYLQLYEDILNQEQGEAPASSTFAFFKNEALEYLNRFARRDSKRPSENSAHLASAIERLRQTPEVDISLQWLYFDTAGLEKSGGTEGKEFKFLRLKELYEANDEKTQFYTAVKNMVQWSATGSAAKAAGISAAVDAANTANTANTMNTTDNSDNTNNTDNTDTVASPTIEITRLNNPFSHERGTVEIAYQPVRGSRPGIAAVFFGYMLNYDFIDREVIRPTAAKQLDDPELFIEIVEADQIGPSLAAVPFQSILQGKAIILNSHRDNYFEALVRRDIRLYYLLLAALILTLGLGIFLFYKYLSREAELVRLKSEFVDGASHTLKTPLTRISLLAENVRQGWVTGETQKEQFFDSIITETGRMSEMIDNMLNFSRVEAGKQHYEPQKTYLQEIAASILDHSSPALNKAGFQLELAMDDQLPAVMVDPKAAKLIIGNLLQNAVKYSLTEKYLKIRVCREGEFAVFEIEDQGIGIPKKQLPEIFKKFNRGTEERVKAIEGSGLGLFLVRHAVDAHGGHITVQSTPGRGSIFTVYFPVPVPADYVKQKRRAKEE